MCSVDVDVATGGWRRAPEALESHAHVEQSTQNLSRPDPACLVLCSRFDVGQSDGLRAWIAELELCWDLPSKKSIRAKIPHKP